MTRLDILIIIACLCLGYWLVNKGLSGSDRTPRDTKPEEGANARDPFGTRHEQSHASAPHPPPQPARIEPATLSNWFRILEIPESATRGQIEGAYRRMITQYHPDKVATLGAEIRAVAEEKSKQLNAAYDIGMRLFRG